ncbi:MAG: hypothetical protein QXQ66_06800 [Candidatus Hadarchaeum sp.]|uniref:hypothetical protein n=1 Tax=Candidatus Hadarchaeum sp. TaxID=2883567 RepID=UPI00316B5433
MERSSVGFLIPFYFFLLGLIVLFSLILLFQGIAGVGREDDLTNTIFVTSGVMGLIVTFYMIRRYQVSVQKMLKSRKITVVTVEECLKCNYKNIRPFREGDFVYGQGGECPKCPKDSEDSFENRMLITAIYLDRGTQEEKP